MNTPNGQYWRRFTFDGYGEQADGGDWDIFTTAERQTLGRAWPLLAGERGEYELIAGKDATARLRAIAGAANDGLMLPEQVWDGRPPGAEPGEGTRSATPLAWTHAQFVRLAWSIQAGRADRAAGDRRLPLPEGALRLARSGTHPAGNAPAGTSPG